MAIFHGPYWRANDVETTQTFHAAIYPQLVALTRLLASPFWRQHILKGWRALNTFVAELLDRTTPGATTRASAGAATVTIRSWSG